MGFLGDGWGTIKEPSEPSLLMGGAGTPTLVSMNAIGLASNAIWADVF